MALERVPWHEIEPTFFKEWGRPNGRVEAEHVSVVGSTGSGKTRFMTYITNKRCEMRGSHAMFIATKPADSTLKKMGWSTTSKYPPEYGKHERFILWPKGTKDAQESMLNQRIMIKTALEDLWKENANTIVVFDEIAYVEDELKLSPLIKRMWREGRSLGLTIEAATQRPRFVTRYMWSESSWNAAFGLEDEDDARRVSEILGGRNKFLGDLLELRRHDFILSNRREKWAVITKLGT